MAPVFPLGDVSCPASLCGALKQVASSLKDLPTKTLAPTPAELRVRQAPAATVTVTAGSGNDATTLSGGAIAGIVIGSIAGFLLLAWILRSCMNIGAPPQEREPQRESWVCGGPRAYGAAATDSKQYDGVEPTRRRSHSSQGGHRHHHHHHHRRSYPEVAAVQTTPVLVRDDRRRSRDYSTRASRSPRRPDDVYVYDSRGRAGGGGKHYSAY